ncbi:MAG: heavy-metal-associated domain-containing protein [Clostridia bacterium]|nr:heavy-metal-associated domain-containing protein [Clostridia bacterium]
MKITYKIKDLCCAHCAAKIEEAIAKLDGIEKANVNFLSEKITVETELDRQALLVQIKDIAAKIEPECTVE